MGSFFIFSFSKVNLGEFWEGTEKDQEVIWAKPEMPWESFCILWAFLLITFIFPFIHGTEHMTVNCFPSVVGKNIVEGLGKVYQRKITRSTCFVYNFMWMFKTISQEFLKVLLTYGVHQHMIIFYIPMLFHKHLIWFSQQTWRWLGKRKGALLYRGKNRDTRPSSTAETEPKS